MDVVYLLEDLVQPALIVTVPCSASGFAEFDKGAKEWRAITARGADLHSVVAYSTMRAACTVRLAY